MKAKLVSIGNSKGIRIPRSIIKACKFEEEVEMRVHDGVVELSPVRGVREGWELAFERMAATGDDAPHLSEDMAHAWDATEWEW